MSKDNMHSRATRKRCRGEATLHSCPEPDAMHSTHLALALMAWKVGNCAGLMDLFFVDAELNAESVALLYRSLADISAEAIQTKNSCLMQAMAFCQRKGHRLQYPAAFHCVAHVFDQALLFSVAAFAALKLSDATWWQASKNSAILLLPEESMEALLRHKGASWESLEAHLQAVTKHSAGRRLFSSTLRSLHREQQQHSVAVAIAKLKGVSVITQAFLKKNTADFLLAARDPFNLFEDFSSSRSLEDGLSCACVRGAVSCAAREQVLCTPEKVKIEYRGQRLEIEVHSSFDHYQVAASAWIRTVGVEQGKLCRLPGENLSSPQNKNLDEDLLVAAIASRAALLTVLTGVRDLTAARAAASSHAEVFQSWDTGARVDKAYIWQLGH
jgi:hypothetical protein